MWNILPKIREKLVDYNTVENRQQEYFVFWYSEYIKYWIEKIKNSGTGFEINKFVDVPVVINLKWLARERTNRNHYDFNGI